MSKKHRIRGTAKFCTGHIDTKKGPKISDNNVRKAPARLQQNWERDLGSIPGGITAEMMFDDDEFKNTGIPNDAHLLTLTMEVKANGEWTEIWSGTTTCSCQQVTA